MANVDLHIYWKGKRKDLRFVAYFSFCGLLIYFFYTDTGTMILVFLMILAYPILAWKDRRFGEHKGELFPTFKKWKAKLKSLQQPKHPKKE